MNELGERLQRTFGESYTIERELGGGGMSHVFLARDNALGRQVVVKLLPPELAATVSIDRFRREIGLAVALQHPHIVGVLSAGEADGLPYFIMPYVEGESLRARIARGPLPVVEAVRILRDVSRALAYAHERGIVHRDIKPDNVLLASGSAAVADFGVAKALSRASVHSGGGHQGTLTVVGTSLGTPAYMAPEQAAADPAADHRADIYAFGAMAYEMLTGVPPLTGATPQALLAAQLIERPKPIAAHRKDVPEALQALVLQCLEKDPGSRPQSAAVLVTALDDPAMVSGAFASATPLAGLPSAPRPPHHVWRAVALGLSALVVLSVLAVLVRARRSPPPAAPPGAATVAPAAAPPRSIAVLPLVNIGRDSTDDYFADGMTEELTSKLSRVPGLRVASRTAAISVRGRNVSPAEIARTLNVGTLLEGTVQRDGKRMRLTARLVNATDGLTLWSDVFESEEKDLFAVQDHISQSIVEALGEELGGPDSAATAAATTHGTANLEAYNQYQRGRFFFERRGETSLRQALSYYQKAVASDPSYALAYAGIADVYAVLPLYSALRADEAWKRGLEAADRAIALDTTLAEGYAARGNLLNGMWRWVDARADLRRAIVLRPSYATAHQWYGENLLLNGQITDAVRELARATELDPVSPIVSGSYALALGIARRYPEAVARARQAVELDPSMFVTRWMLGTVLLYAGQVDSALHELEAAASLAGPVPAVQGTLGYAYAVSGDRQRAMTIAEQLDRAPSADNVFSAAARVRMGLGDTARALAGLERAAQRHETFFASESMVSPLFDPLRKSPRFAALVARVTLDSAVLRQ